MGDEPAPTDRTPDEVVAEWQQRAWGEGDMGAVDDLVTEPFVRHGIGGTVRRSHKELKHDLGEYRKALGRPAIDVRDRTVDGDKVWSRTTMRGAHSITGEPRRIDFIQIHRVADGRIVEVWTLHATDVDWD